MSITSELTRDDIFQILTSFDESDFLQLNLEIGDFKLTVSKKEIAGDGEEGERRSLEKTNSIAHMKTVTAEKNQARVDEKLILLDTAAEETKKDDITVDEVDCISVKSPMVGIFYSAPRPGAPPFVEVGTSVKEGDTYCIIEVMKTMSTIKADVRGTIIKICAENGQMVEYDQILFLVKFENSDRAESQGRSKG